MAMLAMRVNMRRPTTLSKRRPYIAGRRGVFAERIDSPSMEAIMRKHLLATAFAASFFVVSGANAMTKDEYKVEKERIEAEYKVAKAKCDTLSNNAKDVCMKQAKGAENLAKAELEQAYKPSPSHARKVEDEKAAMRYDVAKEKCDSLKGDAKDACVSQAKADRDRAKAHVKAKG
jgi:hypothetical protein